MEVKDLLKGLAPIVLTMVLMSLIYGTVPEIKTILSDPAWIQILIAVALGSWDLATGQLRNGIRKYIGIGDISEAVQKNEEDLRHMEQKMEVLKVIALDGSRAVNAIVDKFEEEYPEEDTDSLITMNFEEVYSILFNEGAAPGDFTRRDISDGFTEND